ncbi:MAG: UvrB/UvrC motif-containing protein [Oscillospiraceae bacterium]|nr:UvrB/UvrC motif-containing protein [Oscillospiraceae bacterium]
MLCDRCHAHPAYINMQVTVNGLARQQHICVHCAQAIQGASELPSILSWDIRRSALRCDVCGMSQQELTNSARVGCAKCYDVFANILTPYIRQIHGQAEYVGDTPPNYTPSPAEQLRKLQRHMQSAIEQQNFEEAARLRDEIKVLEVQHEPN